ncbi:hypothetical protein PMAYCL1PPCAC_22115, partial [Pristionchus mayeri]
LFALFLLGIASAQKAQDNYCPEGFSPLTYGWCYVIIKSDFFTFQLAEDVCYSKYEAHLPSVSTAKINEGLVAVRDKYIDSAFHIWIGLNCSTEGEWYWIDDTPYDESQSNQVPGQGIDKTYCDSSGTIAFVLDKDGYWQARDNSEEFPSAICTIRSSEEITTAATTESPEPEELLCPAGYDRFDVDGVAWCLVWNAALPSVVTVDFQQSQTYCEHRQDETMPILPTDNMVQALESFRQQNNPNAQDIWIGITCNIDSGKWEWIDGEEIDYDHSPFAFRPQLPCNDFTRYAQAGNALWRAYDMRSGWNAYVCMRRAAPGLPSLPTNPPSPASPTCPAGMFLLNDWCYVFGESTIPVSSASDFEMVHHYCLSEFDADLPSVNSHQESNDIMYIRRYYLGSDTENLWIGVVCGRKGKKG